MLEWIASVAKTVGGIVQSVGEAIAAAATTVGRAVGDAVRTVVGAVAEAARILGNAINYFLNSRVSYRIADEAPLVRNVPGNKKWEARAFSVSAVQSRLDFNDSGKKYEFKVDDDANTNKNVVLFRSWELTRWSDWKKLVPSSSTSPSFWPASSIANRPNQSSVLTFVKLRSGEVEPAPDFDMIVASAGRVFAKERGKDRYFFAIVDEMFHHYEENSSGVTEQDPEWNKKVPSPTKKVLKVPGKYFKLDPELNKAAASLPTAELSILKGRYNDHPDAERLEFFNRLFQFQTLDFMMAPVPVGYWNEIDSRPPLGLPINMDIMGTLLDGGGRVIWTIELLLGRPDKIFQNFSNLIVEKNGEWILNLGALFDSVKRMPELQLKQAIPLPPDWIPQYPHITYEPQLGTVEIPFFFRKTLNSIRYDEVLDIAVGHVHWHEMYKKKNGGEIQPLKTFWPRWTKVLNFKAFDFAYRVFNGPVRDGDGFIDGTCNFYKLVKLPENPIQEYAILFIDEQSYFSQRWRLLHPCDHDGLILFALLKDASYRPNFYNFDITQFWDPFRARCIYQNSRMGVARQVVAITGIHPTEKVPVIFTINFSWTTVDRTWRWRRMPTEVALEFPTEKVPQGDVVFTTTIAIREDMTLHLQGKQGGVKGYYYQSYLPANGEMLPNGTSLTPSDSESNAFKSNVNDTSNGGFPMENYRHPWKFVSEDVFKRMDLFSHFGIYQIVDSRSQYYECEIDHELSTAKEWPEDTCWELAGNENFFSYLKFDWHNLPDAAGNWNLSKAFKCESKSNFYGEKIRFKVGLRGKKYVAQFWDKRDDELLPFEHLPRTLILESKPRGQDKSYKLVLRFTKSYYRETAPLVRSCNVGAGSNGKLEVLIDWLVPKVSSSMERGSELPEFWENVWRLKVGILDQHHLGHSSIILNMDTFDRWKQLRTYEQNGSKLEQFRLELDESESNALRSRLSESSYGLSLWFEDILGNVSTPDQFVVNIL